VPYRKDGLKRRFYIPDQLKEVTRRWVFPMRLTHHRSGGGRRASSLTMTRAIPVRCLVSISCWTWLKRMHCNRLWRSCVAAGVSGLSVGVALNLEHMAATPLGAQVVCRARVVYADGPLISFQIEAHDEHEQIARGTHKLRVIEVARLAKRVQSKRQ
jgi:hypothetical protein